nr:unnamed protein product [Spirometra erinaceieuropaei]
MLRQKHLRSSDHLVRMEDTRPSRRPFFSDVATGSRRLGGPKRRYKNTVKNPPEQSSRIRLLKCLLELACLLLSATISAITANGPNAPDARQQQKTSPSPPRSATPVLIAIKHSPYTSTWSVTCESIAQRLANQCLKY